MNDGTPAESRQVCHHDLDEDLSGSISDVVLERNFRNVMTWSTCRRLTMTEPAAKVGKSSDVATMTAMPNDQIRNGELRPKSSLLNPTT